MFLKLMNALSFLAAEATDASWASSIANKLVSLVNAILTPALIVVGAFGIVYCIVLGVEYAKAEGKDKREEAKKRIINAVVGVVIMIVLIIICKLLIAYVPTIKEWIETNAKTA